MSLPSGTKVSEVSESASDARFEPVLEPDNTLPPVPRHPAPWQLTASAYLFVVRMPEQVLDRAAFVPPELVPKRKSRISVAMLVDYQQTNCGPYRELLVTPAEYAFDEGRFMTISRIYVSTYDSVVNGRLNWGIPKDRADFEVDRGADGVEHVRVSRAGKVFAEIQVSGFGPSLPARSWLIPAGMRTLVQHWQGSSYRFTLNARGSVRLAKLAHWHFDPQLFPDLAQGRVLSAAHFPHFEMLFPVAEVRPLQHGG